MIIRKKLQSPSKKVVVLVCEGYINTGENAVAFENAVDQELQAKNYNLILNLAAVSNIDVTGLGKIIASYQKTKKSGGCTKLLSPSMKIWRLLRSLNLLSVFEIFTDENEAVKSFD